MNRAMLIYMNKLLSKCGRLRQCMAVGEPFTIYSVSTRSTKSYSVDRAKHVFTVTAAQNCKTCLILRNRTCLCDVYVSNNYSKMTKQKRRKKVMMNYTSHTLLNYILVQSSFGRWEDIPDGITIDLGYYDTINNINNNSETEKSVQPVVVALHDSPGSHYDLLPILDSLEKTGFRIIAPNFPGFGITSAAHKSQDNIFNHTAEENAELVVTLLDNLDIQAIDLLIACGAGSHSAVRLATERSLLNVKSLVLINPWPHKMFSYLSSNHNLFTRIADICDNRLGYSLIQPFLAMIKNNYGVTVRNKNEFVKFCYTVRGINFTEVGGNLASIEVSNIPRLVIYPEDTSFLETEILQEYLDLQGINIEDKMVIDSCGKITHRGADVLNKCVAIETDSDNVIGNYFKVINGLISNFLDNVKKSR